MPPRPPVQPVESNEGGDQSESFDSLGIHRVESYDRCPKTCPPAIKSVFKLVNESQLLSISPPAAAPGKGGSRSPDQNRSGEDYDMWLRKQAEQLSRKCNDPDMPGHSEQQWVVTMMPIVFLMFNRIEEEELDSKRPFHHWYATAYLAI